MKRKKLEKNPAQPAITSPNTNKMLCKCSLMFIFTTIQIPYQDRAIQLQIQELIPKSNVDLVSVHVLPHLLQNLKQVNKSDIFESNPLFILL